MRHTPWAAVLCWTGLAFPALADDAARWVVEIKGREAGEERVTRTTSEAGVAVHSTGEMRLIQEPFRYTQDLRLGPDGTFRGYRLEAGTHQLEVAVVDSQLQLRGKVVGRETQVDLAAPRPVICLDNLVFSHYDLLGQRAVQAGGGFDLVVLVPQALVAPEGRFEPGEPLTVYGPGGEPIAARRGTLTVAGVQVELTYDAASGRAYAVEVPSQALAARVEGVRLTAAAAAQGPPVTPYAEQEVSFSSAWGTLPGTLTLPRGEGPFPAVLVLPGSGPTDRHSTVGPNRPLEDLARGLAARGVASLRFDKRAHLIRRAVAEAPTAEARAAILAKNEETFAAEYLVDGRAALAWLRAREGVDPARLVILGHSLGALAAPLIAGAEGGEVAGLALLAAPGRPFDVLLEEQITYQARLQGLSEEDARTRARQMLTALREILAGTRPASERVLGATGAYWKDVCARDLAALLRASPLPVLLLWGEEDCQVRRADYDALRAALEGREAPSTCTPFPRLNHLFLPVEGPSTGAEYARPGDVDPGVIEAVATWVQGLAPR